MISKKSINYYDKVILIKSILNSPAHYFPFIVSKLKSGNFQTVRMKLGAFSASDRNKLNDDIETRIKKNRIKLKNDFSKIELKFLNKINDVCKKDKVCLILVNTPVYKASQFTDTSFYYKFKRKHTNNFEFLDFGSFDPGIEGFGDISHLNSKGAILFSKKLDQIFSKKLSYSKKE